MKPTQPSQSEYQRKVDAAQERIQELKTRLASSQPPVEFDRDALNQQRLVLKSAFDALLKQKNQIEAQRNGLLDKIKLIQSNIKKTNDDLKSKREKQGPRSLKDIHESIFKLEKQLSSGGVSLYDEKKIVLEISYLNLTQQLEKEHQERGRSCNSGCITAIYR